MNKIRLVFFAIIVNFSLFSYECDCFNLQADIRKNDNLYYSLERCIRSLPEIEGLHGIIFTRTSRYDLDYSEVVSFYWYSFSDSFSAKSISKLFGMMRRDYQREINFILDWRNKELEKFISGAYHCYWVDDDGNKQCIPYEQKCIKDCQNAKIVGENIIQEAEDIFFKDLEDSISFCRERHDNPIALYESGWMHFLKGNALGAIEDGIAFIDAAKRAEKPELISESYLQQGQAYEETLEYDKAIICLTKAIEANPNNKNAYLERAVAYFEVGDTQACLLDYLTSGLKPHPISKDSNELLSFSLGLTKGILEGSVQAGIDCVPSLLSSLQGIGQGLWAFAQDPVHVSKEFVQAAQACFQFIQSNTPQEVLSTIVPELKELFDQWDQLGDEKKGEISGVVIGKYGVDIFAGVGLTKAMKLYRDLKRANNLMTFEAMAISERNCAMIQLEATRKAQARKKNLQQSSLKVEWDKQGKHLEGHRNFESNNRSILVHSDPQKLASDFCGKGVRAGNKQPGAPGYQEIVDFGEFVGYSVDRDTGEKIATSWGKIHYSKDGVHIVPTKPRR